VILADTSVVVAAALPWHEHHTEAIRALPAGTGLIAHVAAEAFSVLTRLPAPSRVPELVAWSFLERSFQRPFVALDGEGYEGVLRLAAKAGLRGGAIYDALVGASARGAGATLLTLDARAVRAYQAVDAPFRLIG
jgi:predicted nucleic acid-binding protein